jgi:hypothetical protein
MNGDRTSVWGPFVSVDLAGRSSPDWYPSVRLSLLWSAASRVGRSAKIQQTGRFDADPRQVRTRRRDVSLISRLDHASGSRRERPFSDARL